MATTQKCMRLCIPPMRIIASIMFWQLDPDFK
jgi:hypothetical protein